MTNSKTVDVNPYAGNWHIVRKTKRKVAWLAVAGMMLSLSAFATANVANGTLVISVEDGSENIGNPSSAFSSIVKSGNGTAILTGDDFKTFDGNITVEGGTLGATTLEYFGKPTSGKTITVNPGATLDLSTTDGKKYNFFTYKLYIAGTLKRGVANADGGTLGAFSLDGDAEFAMLKNLTAVGGGNVQALNGHELHKTGSGTLTLSGAVPSNGTIRVSAGTLCLKSSNSEITQSWFAKGEDGGRLEMSGGSTLELAPISYENASTADLVFSGSAENTLKCPAVSSGSSSFTVFDRWAGDLTVNSPLAMILTNDLTFTGAATVNERIRMNASAGSLIFEGEDAKTFAAPLDLNGGRVLFRDTGTVTFGTAVTNAATGDAVIAFENAGRVTTGSAKYPFDGVKASNDDVAKGKIPRVVVNGNTVFASTSSALGNSSGTAVFEISGGASVSNLLSCGESNGITLFAVSNGFWHVGAGGNSINPINRDGIGWSGYGDVELSGGMISTVNRGGRDTLTFGRADTSEGTLAMSGGEWISPAVNLGNKGCGTWYQTGGTAVISNNVTVGDSTRPYDGVRGVFTVSGEGTRASIPYENASSSGFIGCCANATVQSIVNLNNGGELRARRFWRDSVAGDDARFYINFDGGVFSTMGPWQIFGNGGASAYGAPTNPPDRVTVYPGGAVFDISQAKNSSGTPVHVDVSVSLRAPTGKGVASISLPAAALSLSYAHRPRVYIEGDGEGATAVAELDPATCRLTGVVVTSPGWDYTEENTHVYISTNVYIANMTTRLANRLECAVTLADNSPDGGIVVRGVNDGTGANNLALWCTNTYRGVTCCQSGCVNFMIPEAYPGGGLDVWKGAIITLPRSATVGMIAGAGSIAGGALSGVTNVVVRAEDVFAPDATPLHVVGLALAEGARVTVEGIGRYAQEHGYATVKGLVKDKLPTARYVLQSDDGVSGSVALETPGLSADDAALFGVRVRNGAIALRGTYEGLVFVFR